MKQSRSDFTVFIDADVYARLRFWVELAGKDEISFLGLVDEIEHDHKTVGLLLNQIFLLDQTVTGIETTLEDKAVAELMIKLSADNIDTSKLKCWIHSHADMKVFWSAVDNECCAMLANGSYSLSIVTNIFGDLLTRLDVYYPCHLSIDGLPTQIDCKLSDDEKENLKSEFGLRVKKRRQFSGSKLRPVPAGDFNFHEAFENSLINSGEFGPPFDDFGEGNYG